MKSIAVVLTLVGVIHGQYVCPVMDCEAPIGDLICYDNPGDGTIKLWDCPNDHWCGLSGNQYQWANAS